MKKLLFLVVITALCYWQFPAIVGLLGIGAGAYGVSADDPLGQVKKLHSILSRAGFEGELGSEGDPRSLEYKHPTDAKQYSDFSNVLRITVGEEEYVQNIEAVFVSTQRGYSPGRQTAVERFISAYWAALSGQRKPAFRRMDTGTQRMGYGISIPKWHMQADFDGNDVKGTWAFNIETSPVEAVRIELK